MFREAALDIKMNNLLLEVSEHEGSRPCRFTAEATEIVLLL
jgi:hypothetical protein